MDYLLKLEKKALSHFHEAGEKLGNLVGLIEAEVKTHGSDMAAKQAMIYDLQRQLTTHQEAIGMLNSYKADVNAKRAKVLEFTHRSDGTKV